MDEALELYSMPFLLLRWSMKITCNSKALYLTWSKALKCSEKLLNTSFYESLLLAALDSSTKRVFLEISKEISGFQSGLKMHINPSRLFRSFLKFILEPQFSSKGNILLSIRASKQIDAKCSVIFIIITSLATIWNSKFASKQEENVVHEKLISRVHCWRKAEKLQRRNRLVSEIFFCLSKSIDLVSIEKFWKGWKLETFSVPIPKDCLIKTKYIRCSCTKALWSPLVVL